MTGPDRPDGGTRKEGTFLVTEADAGTAVLRDVHDGQVHALDANADPALEPGEVVEGTLAARPPTEVTWGLSAVTDRRTVRIEESDEPPTRREREVAADRSVGEVTRRERAGTGELHVLTVPEDGTDAAVADVLDDAETLRARAARLGVERVVVRSAPGVVSVRYLP